ncbi:tRNA dimethylallyltransferase [Candidatus Kryptonium thompsonii]|jgi:tRNA dimethylallyltransferase|uniref:tRNA dimethylallyltransferase n=1 Tax=Candidatus Kryptonium thompsonii TaxID=1633631 RepID=A0A0P1M7C5_9BACT|nr:tRNA (adenosine(37)-N6)-dimethylallyltransferase MiaA [Candidatus Kryptonium thompsoni]CUS77660.1 tRNA dimethylallyltransferase [Candidatus Kryptonium thompsoni]CUS78520.1 tRNA dimethylallyltransferase [Candidatus Kryptonium thompsoni]CUS79957.1 tRNA dimethylallyltransferase [Candidatus Kryptonium thompsoni]CUS87224.1 tRNA dimethylallyltransferase [Candidatus Kryptonium thompsoni]CUS90188.1 tRNA dimethylallyltransferase [Candidatus Kryptonium thompsoni]
MERKVLAIVGPTASGKTKLSIIVAEKINGEIISADSRQIYKYMDIGTAKPSKEERERIRHHFVDELNPNEEFNAGIFGEKGREIIEDIFSSGKVPIVVGGSGLYIRALIDGFFEGPGADWELREILYNKAKKLGVDVLYEELKKVDPESAQKIHPNNLKRVIRALEIYYLTGKPISKLQKEVKPKINFTTVQIGLKWDRKKLYKRIEERVDWMINNGLIEEVKHLRELGYDKNLNSLQTVGYKEVFDYLDGLITYDQMVYLIKRNSRRYAKRQFTWFRQDKRIIWIDVDENTDFNELADRVIEIFKSARPGSDVEDSPGLEKKEV